LNGKTSLEQRYYICTLTDVKTFSHAGQAHINNQ